MDIFTEKMDFFRTLEKVRKWCFQHLKKTEFHRE